MRPLMAVAAVSLLLLAAVGALAAGQKVRIDARAHLAEADSLAGHAEGARDPRIWRRAGEEYVATLRAYTPFDRTPAAAVRGLLDVTRSLPPAEAVALLDEALREIDGLAWVVAPLAAEREDLLARRAAILAAPRALGGVPVEEPGP